MLERELQRWLKEQSASAQLSPLQLEELSDHLLSRAEGLVVRGVPEEEAFQRAVARLGNVTRLAIEFHKENPAMLPISKIVGIWITSLLLFLGISSGLSVGIFLHIPSLVVVFGVVLGGLWTSFGPRSTWRAIRFSCFGAGVPEPGEHEIFDAVLQRGHNLSWAAGVLGTILGVIAMLQNLTDVEQIGPGLAFTLLTLLYGALLGELGFRTLRQWLRASELGRVRA